LEPPGSYDYFVLKRTSSLSAFTRPCDLKQKRSYCHSCDQITPVFFSSTTIYNLNPAIMADSSSHDQLISEFVVLTGASPSDVCESFYEAETSLKADFTLHRPSSTSPRIDGISQTPLPNTSQLKKRLLHEVEMTHKSQKHTPVPALSMAGLLLILLPPFQLHQALPLVKGAAVSQHWVHCQVLTATLDADMREMTMMMTVMKIMSLVSSLEICLQVVRSQVWRFRILQTEMIRKR
jgi:hypothetical protein